MVQSRLDSIANISPNPTNRRAKLNPDRWDCMTESSCRKFDSVIQWVLPEKGKVPPDQRSAARSVANLTCKTSNGSTKLRETSMQGLY